MKTRFLTALVVDQDATQGRAMAALIKDLFNRVHFEQKSEEVIRECQDVKPRVIFINLTLPQRTTSFEILSKIPRTEQTVFFGYTDAHEPEFVAHAIEEGLHDIFTKPYDPDIVATKINKFFLFDKTQERQISYNQLKPAVPATLAFKLKLLTVDENGFQFKCDHYVSKGTPFKAASAIIRDIFEEDSIDLMVTRTWLGDSYGEYFFFAEPMLAIEKNSTALRRFILRKV